jgi:probable rRNA maturation factor
MKIKISISKPYKKWNIQKDITRKHISNVLEKVLLFHKNLQLNSAELSILLTNDLEISELNSLHRKQEFPTNILSFPESDEILYKKNISQKFLYLGDLALSYDKILKESQERNISFYNHFTHLLIHGILHLLGYDHEHDIDADQMECVEVNLLKNFNIPTPY